MKQQNLSVLRILQSLLCACMLFSAFPIVSSLPSSEDDDLLIFGETPSPVTATTPAAPSDAEDTLPMDLPVIGTVNLVLFTEGSTSGMKVYVPKKGTQIIWGPLTIDEGELRLVNEVPSYQARATLFGSSARLSIKKAFKEAKPQATITTKKGIKENIPSFPRLVFGIQFIKNPTIELIPGKKAELTNIDLVLEKNKPVQLIASTNLLSQPVVITFSISKAGTDAWAEFKGKIPFDSIIPSLRFTAAKKIELTSFKLAAKHFGSKTKKVTYLIDGKADVSQLAGLEGSAEARDVAIHGSYTEGDKGSLFTLKAPALTLPGIGKINDAAIVLDFKQFPAKLKLTGNTKISFPTVGDFDTVLDASITSGGIEFSSSIAQTVRFANIDIKNIAVQFSSAKKLVSLTGDGQVDGYQAKITVAKDAKGGVIAQAALTEKEIKPFSAIPAISDIALKDPIVTFEKKATGYELFMAGIVTLFGVPLHGELNVKKTADGKTVTLLQAAAPANWKLSDGMPTMKGTLFDNIVLEELAFIVSSNEYRDIDKGVTFKKGLNFVSKTKLSGPLVPVSEFTKTPSTSLITIAGYLAPNPLDSVFRASVPNGAVIKNNSVTLGKLELEIAGNPAPDFSLLTVLTVKPSTTDELLTLTARIKLKSPPFSATLAGTMQGFWSHPFGIGGLEVGNVAAEIAFGPPFPATGIPASIGLAGQITLGSRHAAIALKIPLAGDVDTVLCGALDKLTLDDVISTAIQLAGQASGSKLKQVPLPDIGIEDMKLYVAPKATTIGELAFEKGLTVRGVLYIPGFKAFGNITVSSSGLIAQASCSEIRYGPKDLPLLLISRAKEDTTKLAFKHSNYSPELLQSVDAVDSLDIFDAPALEDPVAQESLKTARPADVACAPDSKLLAEYNGPTMRIILNMEQDLSKQGILVSGLFKVADIFEQDSYFRMDKNGIEFNFETVLGKAQYNGKPLLQTIINGKSSGALSNPEFKLILDFQQYLLTYAKEQATAAIAKAKEDVHKGIASARLESDTKIDQASKEAEAGVEKAKADVQKAKDALAAIDEQIVKVKTSMRAAIIDARANRDTVQRNIDSLDKQIAEKKKTCG